VRAQIRADDRLLFTSDTATPVITNGHPTTVAITLRPVPNRQPNSSSSAAQEPGTLEGTSWTAVEVYGTPVTPQVASPDRDPHLVFGAGGRVAGADGCNRLTGPYTVKGNGITFGDLAGTQMACPKTDELARRFRAALKGTGHWSLVKGRLEFYGATGKPLVVFERRPSPAPSGEAALQGTRWQLVRFQGGDDRTIVPPDPSSYTLEFTSGGQLAARIDCNRGRGTWKATPAGQLELGALSLTRMKCPDGSLHDQMVKHWPSVRSFVMKDGHLFLSLMADGGTYEFAPVGAAKQ
jgi:heat shock protein HslJ